MTYGLMFLRGKSRRIPGKNTKLFMDKPLYQWNAEVMLKSSFVNRLIICTEDTEIKNQVARFLEWPNSATRWLLPRPSILATDTANIIDNINWCLKEVTEAGDDDIFLLVQATSPYLRESDIEKAVTLLKDGYANSVMTGKPLNGYLWRPHTHIEGIWAKDSWKCTNSDRRFKTNNGKTDREHWIENGCLYGTRVGLFKEHKTLSIHPVKFIEQSHSFELDEPMDWAIGEAIMKFNTPKKTYCFDVDGVICEHHAITQRSDGSISYHSAYPLKENIARINALYDAGNIIILYTARGQKSGEDVSDLTENQLAEWGVKYHMIHYDKPAADVYVDDRAINVKDWENENLTDRV